MKTWRNISIGDTIYRLCSKYDLGNPKKEQVTKVIVKDLSIDESNGNLLINKVSVYSGGSYWAIVVKKEKLDKAQYNFNPEQNTHRAGYYFTEEADINRVVRRSVISKISQIEKSIPVVVAQRKQEICDIRSMFHELLNPTFYPNYTIH